MKKAYLYIIVLIVTAIDQLTKFYFTHNYPLGISTPVIKNLFHITVWRNSGGAFGLSFISPVIITIITAVVSIALIILMHTWSARLGLALALILSGSLGNLIDRIRLGYVIDYIDLRIWPIFNVADIAITAGMILLFYQILFSKKNDKSTG